MCPHHSGFIKKSKTKGVLTRTQRLPTGGSQCRSPPMSPELLGPRGVGGARDIRPDGADSDFISQALGGGCFLESGKGVDTERAAEMQAPRASEVERLRRELEESNRKARRLDEALRERDRAMV
ncbi:uncharacterized protein A4U43_C03F12900 [Asparagus officinalis]|uniref:Uncharacterized protein n=1 Tax=Asparagus officinalis TaxID=4686 RepID=A0A5P1FES6_ASPOF|nr:uncharacterized protein A4U43_C03F12900 [Asparagus officinalis]